MVFSPPIFFFFESWHTRVSRLLGSAKQQLEYNSSIILLRGLLLLEEERSTLTISERSTSYPFLLHKWKNRIINLINEARRCHHFQVVIAIPRVAIV